VRRLVACLLLGLGALAARAEERDLERLLREARRVQEADLEAWRRFAFRRVVERERLDAGGRTKSRQVLEFEIRPLAEGFDEVLTRVDGQPPAAAAVREHREAARFTRHYREARGAGAEREEDNLFSLFDLLYLGSYADAGREMVAGVPCRRLDFVPSAEPPGEGRGAAIGAALAGSIWLTEDGLHLSRAEARAVRPVSFAIGLARLAELEVEMETFPVEAGVWLPSRIQVRSTLRVLGVPSRRRTTFRYSHHQAAAARPPDSGRGAPGATDD
jgi:hypothetical protein